MPDSNISSMPAATLPLTGTETVPVLQGGGNDKTTTQAIANLAPAVAAILVESGAAVKVSAMSAAGALAGTEAIDIVQAGANVKTTLQAIANLAPAQASDIIQTQVFS
jgi:hypothetical protein